MSYYWHHVEALGTISSIQSGLWHGAAGSSSHRSAMFNGACVRAVTQRLHAHGGVLEQECAGSAAACLAGGQAGDERARAGSTELDSRQVVHLHQVLDHACNVARSWSATTVWYGIDGSLCHQRCWRSALQQSNARVMNGHRVALIRMIHAGAPSPPYSLHWHICKYRTAGCELTKLPEEEDPPTRARDDWRRFNRRAAGHSRRLPSLQAGRCTADRLHRNPLRWAERLVQHWRCGRAGGWLLLSLPRQDTADRLRPAVRVDPEPLRTKL